MYVQGDLEIVIGCGPGWGGRWSYVALGEIWVERAGGKKEGGCSNLRAEDLGLKGWVGRRKVDLVGTGEENRGARCVLS